MPFEVERVVEKIVEVEKPVYIEQIVLKEVSKLDAGQASPLFLLMHACAQVPVPVEKIIYRDVTVPVEKVVEVPVHEIKVVEVIKEVRRVAHVLGEKMH